MMIMSEQIDLQLLFASRVDVKTKDEKRFVLHVVNSKKRGDGHYALVVHDKYVQRNIMVVETFESKVVQRFDSLLKEYQKSNTIVVDKVGIDSFRIPTFEELKEVNKQININYATTSQGTDNRVIQS